MIYRRATIRTEVAGLHQHIFELEALTADDLREIEAFVNTLLDKLIKRMEDK